MMCAIREIVQGFCFADHARLRGPEPASRLWGLDPMRRVCCGRTPTRLTLRWHTDGRPSRLSIPCGTWLASAPRRITPARTVRGTFGLRDGGTQLDSEAVAWTAARTHGC